MTEIYAVTKWFQDNVGLFRTAGSDRMVYTQSRDGRKTILGVLKGERFYGKNLVIEAVPVEKEYLPMAMQRISANDRTAGL